MMIKPEFGVLLVNLGTSKAPTALEVKRYLREFLNDRRVVDLPGWLWKPILEGFILPFRSPRLAKLYTTIWLPEGSPLVVYGSQQCQQLQQRLPKAVVAFATTYGEPAILPTVNTLLEHGINRLIILPLYPQNSSTTTLAVWDKLVKVFIDKKFLPTIHFIHDYAQHPLYIQALVESITRAFNQYGQPEKLIFSYHGIPQKCVKEGDQYPFRCEATTQAVVAQLQLKPEQYMLTYQSRFGKASWLTPYTDETLKTLAQSGIKSVQVVCPGFSADCLETLEEIEIQNRNLFLSQGGRRYEYIPALNAQKTHIDLLEQLCLEKRVGY